MKKICVLSVLCVAFAGFFFSCWADDTQTQVSALEQRAERVQSQINQAKQQSEAGLDAQIRAITASIDNLVRQRVQLDAHISKLEAQIDDLKKQSQSSLSRQIKSYDEELGSIKQQISSIVTKKSQETAQKAAETPDNNAGQSVNPTQAQ